MVKVGGVTFSVDKISASAKSTSGAASADTLGSIVPSLTGNTELSTPLTKELKVFPIAATSESIESTSKYMPFL